MDKRNRDANKRHRKKEGEAYFSATLMLDQAIVDRIAVEAPKREDNNASALIEEVVTENIHLMQEVYSCRRRQKKGSGLVKKTYTLSESFIEIINKTGSRNLAVCDVLNQAWGLGLDLPLTMPTEEPETEPKKAKKEKKVKRKKFFK